MSSELNTFLSSGMADDGSEVTICVTKLSKCYQIYESPRDRLKQFIVPRLQSFFRRSFRQYFQEFWALSDVTFEIKKGETLGIIGRNGSGKSTLLQMICGTLSPTSGSVEIRGRIAALLELGTGFNPEFTGRENIYLNAIVLGLSKEEVDERFDDIVAFADIGQFIEQPVKMYSSGMYVRLAFAVIAHVDADVLMIDEALAVGDAYFVQKCMRFLRDFRKKGTLLFVSHDMSSVLNFCHDVIYLEAGRVKSHGAAKLVVEKYMQGVYEENQGLGSDDNKLSVDVSKNINYEFRDQRLDFINQSEYRNDIQIFRFDESAASFGKKECEILDVVLFDEANNALNWLVGGECVKLRIKCVFHNDINLPIIGFIVKDKLGQHLFGDNTYLTYMKDEIAFNQGDVVTAEFVFRMPILNIGKYSIATAIAAGTQEDHVQHHWLHDALVFEVHSTSITAGLAGVPMKSISIMMDAKE